MTTIYHYDYRGNNEFLASGTARPDPMEEDRYLVPAGATTVEPPAIGQNETAVFDPVAETWSLVADYRGQTYPYGPVEKRHGEDEDGDGLVVRTIDQLGVDPSGEPAVGSREIAVFDPDSGWAIVPDYRGVTVWYRHLSSTYHLQSRTIEVIGDEPQTGESETKPDPTVDEWKHMISERADLELNRGASFTASDGTAYTVRTGEGARGLISGAGLRAEVTRRDGTVTTRRVPTDKGVIAFDQDDLWTMFERVEQRHEDVMARVEQLEAEVAGGTMTFDKLDSGWPAV